MEERDQRGLASRGDPPRTCRVVGNTAAENGALKSN